MLGGIRRLRGLPEATQVGANHGVTLSQERSDTVPSRMGPGVPVQQEYRRPGTAPADPQGCLRQFDQLERESLEHKTLSHRATDVRLEF